ncbi:MAG: DUF3106 domain-containing protein [Dechloromonas sp.]|nr:MAG: DUF3106 domain-containing protein [Dechloromonas sp.]
MAHRRLARRIILCLALASPAFAAPPTSVVIGTPPQPTWAQLTPQQKSTLAPLVKDWDEMENVRRKKWLGIAERYPTMRPEEQARMQERMREWARLTPEQRAKVRDTYKDFNQLPPEQKQTVKQKWEAYSSLSDEEKQRVRETGKSSRLLAPPPVAPIENSPSSANTDAAQPQQ